MSSLDSPGWFMYLSVAVLILFSAFFSAAETAVSSFNRIRLKKQAQEGNRAAETAIRIAEGYDKTLSTILIGNNVVNIAASSIATIIATSLFGGAGALISTVVMTLLVLTFGEILPKNYARENADQVALRFAGPLAFLSVVLTPVSFFFIRLSRSFSGSGEDSDSAPSVTEEELMYIIDSIEEEGVLEEQERDLVQSALEFDEISIREIITPRVNLSAVDIADDPEEITERILRDGYARMPVYDGSVDNIIGILFTRDYLRCIIRGEPVDLRAMLHDPYFVHKGMKLSHLLTNLRSRQVNMAVVLDEYGGTLGVVTMEDVLEELVGDIWDEDDEIPDGLIRLGENCYEVSGSHDISELLEEFQQPEEDPDAEYTTVSGWAIHLLEHIPKAGEVFYYRDLKCTVLEMEGRRITSLGIERVPLPGPEDGEDI